ncbi:glycosyltransferase [uncultured Chloroflexus sp.]|uniref:glycosyltransferase n=1 Tax=uncultured Chloroflexus sp. TaxID=214040 RepID=UPI00261C7923|nr:glycosyltransferase [uncultured Chloroflexus sp.]
MKAVPDLKVIWQSRWGLPIGYSLSSEAIALQLDQLGVDLFHRPTPWHMPAELNQPRLREIAARSLPDDALQVSYDQADLFYTEHRGYRIGYTMLEVNGLPADWIAACNRMDEIWTPSRWGAETFAAAGVYRPIHVMPLGYDPEHFNTQIPAYRLDNRFTFLSIFEWGERKAPELLLRAYCSAFSRNDDVVLILRINNFDRSISVSQQIANLRLPPDSPPIVILYNQYLSRAQLGSLYRSADCFVLATRGEGWGLPILEAMACGLPVIATNWSAQTEFFRAEVGFPVNVRTLVPAEAKCPYYTGWSWAEPDFDHLVWLMRYVYEHPAEARSVGHAAAAEVAQRWTWRHTAERIVARLAELA